MGRRAFVFSFGLGVVLAFISSTAMAQFQLTNLDSNQSIGPRLTIR